MVRKPPRGVRESEIPCPGNAGLLSHRRRLQAADVDLLSGHRVGLDVGIDWNYVEYQARALGRDFRTRGARQGEQIQLLRRFFTQSVGDFPGRYHRADRAHSHPNRHPNPIWAGGIRRNSIRPGRPTRADDSDCRRRARRSTVARVAVVGCSPAVEELATIHARAGARICLQECSPDVHHDPDLP